jgi:CcmD family protein
MVMKKTLVSLLLIGLVLGAVIVAAQPAPSTPAQEGFVPASSLPQAEQLPAAPLLIAAYAFVWVALLVYVWLLWRRTAKLERELADLNRRLQQR